MSEVYLETTRKMRGDAPYFVDKLPQNYLMLPLILAALPNAKIVHLTRDPMDACFDFHTQDAAVSTASAVQVREPAHTRSVGRWKRYGGQLQPMVEILAAEGITINP